MELYQAHNQWANRPEDERFASVKALYDATRAYAQSSVERSEVPFKTLSLASKNNQVQLVGKGGVPANLTHWAFGQLAARCDAPASYLRSLPADLAVTNLNHGLARRQSADDTANLLLHANGSYTCRSITSDRYERIWNWEVAERLLDLETRGWKPALPTIRKSIGDYPALYASDHDMFAFMSIANVAIQQPVKSNAGDSAPLYKGLIYGNSEVGGGSLFAMSFWYNAMCGNHIIWGASNVTEFRARHVGTIRERTQAWEADIRRYAQQSVSEDQVKINQAATKMIAATKDELLDVLFGKRLGLSRKAIEASYEACIPEQDGNPLTVWGFVQGATRYSQTVPYADSRMTVDRAAAKILTMAF